MFRPSVQHVIQEANASPYPNVLGGCYLGSMVVAVLRRNRGVGRMEVFVGEGIRLWKEI